MRGHSCRSYTQWTFITRADCNLRAIPKRAMMACTTRDRGPNSLGKVIFSLAHTLLPAVTSTK